MESQPPPPFISPAHSRSFVFCFSTIHSSSAEDDHVLAYLVKPIKRADLETAIAIALARFEQFRKLQSETHTLREALEDQLIECAKGLVMKQSGAGRTSRLHPHATPRQRKQSQIGGGRPRHFARCGRQSTIQGRLTPALQHGSPAR